MIPSLNLDGTLACLMQSVDEVGQGDQEDIRDRLPEDDGETVRSDPP